MKKLKAGFRVFVHFEHEKDINDYFMGRCDIYELEEEYNAHQTVPSYTTSYMVACRFEASGISQKLS